MKRFYNWFVNYFWDGQEDFKNYWHEMALCFKIKK